MLDAPASNNIDNNDSSRTTDSKYQTVANNADNNRLNYYNPIY